MEISSQNKVREATRQEEVGNVCEWQPLTKYVGIKS